MNWIPISEQLPESGQVIACAAPHRAGGLMYWAGTVADVNGPWVIMVKRGEHERRFIITHDTLWVPLPGYKPVTNEPSVGLEPTT